MLLLIQDKNINNHFSFTLIKVQKTLPPPDTARYWRSQSALPQPLASKLRTSRTGPDTNGRGFLIVGEEEEEKIDDLIFLMNCNYCLMLCDPKSTYHFLSGGGVSHQVQCNKMASMFINKIFFSCFV